jgi:class 3 adenylate cyclase/tetratricopeptide (TPR) repeat protein
VSTCAVCGYEASDVFKFCPECGATTARRTSEQRKVVSVLFCDVVGSTALGESADPEALRALLVRYFERMKAIVERHGGTVEKFIGDAVMAVFGVPVAHEDDALRACRAALEMRDALPALEVEGRIGVATGEVVTGTEERLATGDAVNVAARLQQAAQPGEALVGEGTRALVGAAAELEAAEPLALKGKAEPVSAFRLLAVHEAERRPEAPFVGRERELAAIREAWERARAQRRCELVTIVGEAGVGKSRLVAEALASVDARVVYGRCLTYGEGITYWPVVEILKELGASPSDETAVAAIRSLLGETDAATSAEEIAWAFRKTLEQAAAEQPLVVVCDDIQWGEETFLDLLEHVALLSSGASILLLGMARPELIERRASWPVMLRVEPLGAEDVDELIPGHISGGLRAKIARVGGGNPLFVEEMVALAGEAEDEVVVPPTLQALLATRLDQLDPAERRVLERGAVEGEVFHRGAVQALAAEESKVTPRLAALVRKGLIRPEKSQLAGEDGFRFRHLLIRDAAYDAMPKGARAELHERFAAWLEQRGPDFVASDEILGYHLEQAYRYRVEIRAVDDHVLELAHRGAERLVSAGNRAVAREDMNAAAILLSRAAELLAGRDPDRLPVLARLGEVLRAVGRLDEATTVLDDVIERAKALGDVRIEWRAVLERSLVKRSTEPQAWVEEQTREDIEQAIEACENLDYDEGVMKAWRLLGALEANRGNIAAAEQPLERALAYARRSRDERAERQILGTLGQMAVVGPTRVHDAIPIVEGHLEIARARDHAHWEANCYDNLAMLRAMRGQFAEARGLVASARALREKLGLPVAGGAWDSATVEMLAGDWAAAEREYRAAYRLYEESGNMGMAAPVAALCAHALLAQGRDEEAFPFTELSEKNVASDDVDTQALSRRALAKLLAHRGDLAEAERLATEALELAGTTDDLNSHGDALCDLAEILVASGRTDEAVAMVEQALARYERKQNIVMAERARARLADLKPSDTAAERA